MPPVLIVGAGPTGLTLAIELARRGIPFRLIDRDARRAETSRAIGTQARTVEVFQLMGIPESALRPAVWPRALRLAERERTLARIPFAPGPGGPPRLVSMDESDTERVLEERLVQLGGRIEQSTELVGFRLDGEGVVATVETPEGRQEIGARFLAGTDGANSVVRRDAGIAFAGARYPERFLLVDMDIDWALPHEEGHIWIGDEGLVAVVPLPGERRYRVIVPLPAADAEKTFGSEAEIVAVAESLLRQRSGIAMRRVGEPDWASSFRIQRRQAEHYRQGPVFLAGDAAHVHSPVGGQGMNMGIQDAFNLGWKLALAVQGQAAPGLLDTYEEERHPIARGVLGGTHLATRLFLAQNPLMRAVREYGVPAVVNVPGVRQRALAAISQLGVNYRDSPLSVDASDPRRAIGPLHLPPHGLMAGDRVSDATVQVAGSGEAMALFDLFGRGWTMLLLPGNNSTPEAMRAVEEVARQTGEAVGDMVQLYLVLSGLPRSEPGTTALLDPTGDVARIFGAGAGLVVLVRPDGYLGYRGRPEQQGELASYLARVFAMRLRPAEGGR